MAVIHGSPSRSARSVRFALWRRLFLAGTLVRRAVLGQSIVRPLGFEPGETVPAEVVAYFADSPSRLYQLTQWLPVLERLSERHPVLLVLREPETYYRLEELTALRRVLLPQFAQLTDFYAENDYRVCLYVNNASRNFQSLSHQTMLHVHVSHGESDKISMVSNQAKAYDRVFVAGEAAIRRHRAALIGFDERKLVPVGRPQLDLLLPPALPPSDRRTVLYAPTWEGENAANNYTSVDLFGESIVEAVLSLPNVRFVYKPHPRLAMSPLPHVRSAHERISGLVERARAADPAAGHRVVLEEDILAVIPCADAMIADVSSVGLDFLYLATDKPLFVTDRRNDRRQLALDAPVTDAADVIDERTVAFLPATLSARLEHDEHRDARERLRRYYFGDVAVGESTRRFVDAVTRLAAERDSLLARRARASSGEDATASAIPVGGAVVGGDE